MLRRADQNELQSAADSVRSYVDAHDAKPYSTDTGSFLVCYAKLEVPRVIGERTANFLRLFKALSGDTLAGAIYNKFGYKARENSDVFPEMPVRCLIFMADLAASTHVWEGSWDANDRPITSSDASELIQYVAAATPHEALLRPDSKI